MKITSPQNPRIKYLKRLSEKESFRKKERKFILEGPSFINHLFERDYTPESIVTCPDFSGDVSMILKKAEERKVPVIEVNSICYSKFSSVKSPQGVASVVPFPNYEPEKILKNSEGVFLVADGLQDPGNLGTLIRTCDAAGANGLITLPPSASFYNPKTVRSSAGSVVNIPILEMSEEKLINLCEQFKINIYGAVPRKGSDLRKIKFNRPLCIIVGSESHGISSSLMQHCRPVAIPMRFGVESLNASVAGALFLYSVQYGVSNGEGKLS